MKSLRETTHDRLDDVMHLTRETPIDMSKVANDVMAEAEFLIDELIKAFGNCENCYGKGYNTQQEGVVASGRDVFRGPKIVCNFCSCERGVALQILINDRT